MDCSDVASDRAIVRLMGVQAQTERLAQGQSVRPRLYPNPWSRLRPDLLRHPASNVASLARCHN
eukprot:304529-Pleurochrysis_carterae.AAC.2